MTELNALYLSNTQLPECPYGLMDAPELHTLNLSGNRISELPEGFHQSQLWRLGRVELSGNRLGVRRMGYQTGICLRPVACLTGCAFWMRYLANVEMKWLHCGPIWRQRSNRKRSSIPCRC